MAISRRDSSWAVAHAVQYVVNQLICTYDSDEPAGWHPNSINNRNPRPRFIWLFSTLEMIAARRYPPASPSAVGTGHGACFCGACTPGNSMMLEQRSGRFCSFISLVAAPAARMSGLGRGSSSSAIRPSEGVVWDETLTAPGQRAGHLEVDRAAKGRPRSVMRSFSETAEGTAKRQRR